MAKTPEERAAAKAERAAAKAAAAEKRAAGFASFEDALATARAERAAEDAAKPKKARKSKAREKGHVCACGQCGTLVAGTFAPGHDGRVLGWFVALTKGKDSPEVTENPALQSAFVKWASNGKGHSLKGTVAAVVA